MKATVENIDKLFDFIKGQHESNNVHGEFDEDMDLKDVLENAFKHLDEEDREPALYILKENGIQCNLSSNKFIELNEKIRDKELHEYSIIDREDFIEELYRWIGEAKDGVNKQMMKDDLDMLRGWDDKYIFSSNSTNSYISSNCAEFNETCEELIKINESL